MNIKLLLIINLFYSIGYTQIGIGTTAPGQKLDVQNGHLRLMNSSSSTDIEFKNTTSKWNAGYVSQILDGSTFGSHLAFKLHSSDSGLTSLPIESFRIKSNGNVGIRNSNPMINFSIGSTNLNQRIGRAIIDGISQHSVNKRDTMAIGRWDGSTLSDNYFLGIKYSLTTGVSVGEPYDNQSFMTFHTWGDGISNSREVMRVDFRGRLGLGMIPNYILDVNSTNDIVSRLSSNNSNGAAIMINPIFTGALTSYIYSTANSNSLGGGKMVFVHNNLNTITINSQALIGIGNTTPSVRLHIKENTANTDALKMETNITSTGFNSLQGVTIQNNGGVGSHIGFLFRDSSGWAASGFGCQLTDNTNHFGDFVFGGRHINDVWFERMRILSIGNVGLGTSTPAEKVEVNGAIKVGNPYSGVTNGGTAPVPSGGAGTIIFNGTNFFGWNGASWKQLDN